MNTYKIIFKDSTSQTITAEGYDHLEGYFDFYTFKPHTVRASFNKDLIVSVVEVINND